MVSHKFRVHFYPVQERNCIGYRPLLGIFYSVLTGSTPTRYSDTDSLVSVFTSVLACEEEYFTHLAFTDFGRFIYGITAVVGNSVTISRLRRENI